MSIKSAGCLIIGDEVLNGKIQDTNSFEFAKFCFNLKLTLKKVIVCSDDLQDIQNSLKILDNEVDFIVTSGGLGSTHDDVSYEAIASYYNVPYSLDQQVVSRMKSLRGDYISSLNLHQQNSYYKMATIPISTPLILIQKYFVDNLWFPIVAIQNKVFILPGIPQLFTKLIENISPIISPKINTNTFQRFYIKTTSSESYFAKFLGDLQSELDSQFGKNSIKLGSYPHIDWSVNTISIIVDLPSFSQNNKNQLINKIIAGVEGNAVEITAEEEEKLSIKSPKL